MAPKSSKSTAPTGPGGKKTRAAPSKPIQPQDPPTEPEYPDSPPQKAQRAGVPRGRGRGGRARGRGAGTLQPAYFTSSSPKDAEEDPTSSELTPHFEDELEDDIPSSQQVNVGSVGSPSPKRPNERATFLAPQSLQQRIPSIQSSLRTNTAPPVESSQLHHDAAPPLYRPSTAQHPSYRHPSSRQRLPTEVDLASMRAATWNMPPPPPQQPSSISPEPRGPTEQQLQGESELPQPPLTSTTQIHKGPAKIPSKNQRAELVDLWEQRIIKLAKEAEAETGIQAEKIITRCIPGREKVTGNRHNTFMRMHRYELGPEEPWDQQAAEEAYQTFCEKYPTSEAQDEELQLFAAIADLDLGETTPAARKKNFISIFAKVKKLVEYGAKVWGFHTALVMIGGNDEVDSFKSMNRFLETFGIEGFFLHRARMDGTVIKHGRAQVFSNASTRIGNFEHEVDPVTSGFAPRKLYVKGDQASAVRSATQNLNLMIRYYGLKGHSIEQEDGEFRMCPWNHLRKTLDNNGMVLQGWPWVTRGPATEGYVPGETGSSSSTKPGKDAVSGLSGPAVCALAEAIESGAITIEDASAAHRADHIVIRSAPNPDNTKQHWVIKRITSRDGGRDVDRGVCEIQNVPSKRKVTFSTGEDAFPDDQPPNAKRAKTSAGSSQPPPLNQATGIELQEPQTGRTRARAGPSPTLENPAMDAKAQDRPGHRASHTLKGKARQVQSTYSPIAESPENLDDIAQQAPPNDSEDFAEAQLQEMESDVPDSDGFKEDLNLEEADTNERSSYPSHGHYLPQPQPPRSMSTRPPSAQPSTSSTTINTLRYPHPSNNQYFPPPMPSSSHWDSYELQQQSRYLPAMQPPYGLYPGYIPPDSLQEYHPMAAQTSRGQQRPLSRQGPTPYQQYPQPGRSYQSRPQTDEGA